jgi:hypothetical protein
MEPWLSNPKPKPCAQRAAPGSAQSVSGLCRGEHFGLCRGEHNWSSHEVELKSAACLEGIMLGRLGEAMVFRRAAKESIRMRAAIGQSNQAASIDGVVVNTALP